ncbi:Lon protease [Paracoccus haematequi]|uniref:Lon protease n=1 Tax=Paracoccus haematequi TaxID=2491866 RepID=A0A447IR88_9RHOB|nr:AAA family ATPase [Paracoccus haematequi]VDS10027.1 Lon protease [Paracoccus haematequi]
MIEKRRVLDPALSFVGLKKEDLAGRVAQCRRHVIVAARIRSADIQGLPPRILSLDEDGDPERREYLLELDQIPDMRIPVLTLARDKRRARRLWQRLSAASMIDIKHLSEAERGHLRMTAAQGAVVAGKVSMHRADEIVAALHEEAPWMRELHIDMLRALREAARTGAGFYLPPSLVVGPPGTGKSAALRRIAEILRIPHVAIDASTGGHFGVVGMERGWGAAHPGAVSQTIIGRRIYNPVIILDEVEKAAGDVQTNKGNTVPGLQSTLLPLLEPITAAAWRCPYYGVPVDARGVTYLMTANSLDGLSAPLRSRLRVYHVDHLSADHLVHAARRQCLESGLEEDVREAISGLVRDLRARRPVHLREISAIVGRMKAIDGPESFLH